MQRAPRHAAIAVSKATLRLADTGVKLRCVCTRANDRSADPEYRECAVVFAAGLESVVFTRVFVVMVLSIAGTVCSTPSAPPVASGPPLEPPVAATGTTPAPATADPDGTVTGVVAETMNAGGYTYARLRQANGETWIAATEFQVVIGATIRAIVDTPMRGFRSRVLNREFAEISFVRDVVMNGSPVTAAAGMATAGEPAMAGSHGERAAAPALIDPVPAAPGGVTIAEVWAQRTALSGRSIVVRGQVMKANLAILGTNWYHLQDGSGVVAAGTHDLVVTSAAELATGDVVTARGVLTTGKDFGAGYAYEAIVEGADIRKQATRTR